MRTVVLDLEAVGIDKAGEYLDQPPPIVPPDLDAIQPAKNLVDPAKIAADIEKRKLAAVNDYDEHVRAAIERWEAKVAACSLDPDLCRIVALGWKEATGPDVTWLQTMESERLEAMHLQHFWDLYVNSDRFITFNGFGYDLPVLMRRSLYLGIRCPALSLDRYRSPHVDLMQKLSYNGAIKAHGLRFYAKRLGLTTEDTVTGAEIAGLVAAGEWDKVRAHCESDVRLTYQLAQRLGVIPSHVEMPETAEIF